MELQLGLSLSTNDPDEVSSSFKQRKRSFSYAFDDENDVVDQQPPTLPLMLWSKQPNEEDDPKDSHKSSSSLIDKDDGGGLVGWPPIKFRRSKAIKRRQNNPTVDNGCDDCHCRVSNSMYVKVKMEGVAIARKIDLSIFNSFEDLKQILIGMFWICEANSSSYRLTYQDREGDWLLAEDVSWRSFIRSVQRLKLIKSSST